MGGLVFLKQKIMPNNPFFWTMDHMFRKKLEQKKITRDVSVKFNQLFLEYFINKDSRIGLEMEKHIR